MWRVRWCSRTTWVACVPQSGSRVRQSAAEWIRDRLRAGPWAKVPDNGCGQYLLHRALEVLVSGSRGSVLVRWEATWEAFRGCFHHFGSRTQGRVHGWSWSELNRASSAGPEQGGVQGEGWRTSRKSQARLGNGFARGRASMGCIARHRSSRGEGHSPKGGELPRAL